jgi:hypothetical protein
MFNTEQMTVTKYPYQDYYENKYLGVRGNATRLLDYAKRHNYGGGVVYCQTDNKGNLIKEHGRVVWNKLTA